MPHAGQRSLLIDDELLIQLAIAAEDGGKFRRLWDGDVGGYHSPSEARMALLCKLAYWTGKNVEQMDRLFRRSALMTAKFDSRRGDTTLGWQEIASACNVVTEVFQPRDDDADDPGPRHPDESLSGTLNTAAFGATTSPQSLGAMTSSSTAVATLVDLKDRSFPLLGANGHQHASGDAEAEAGTLLRRGQDGKFPLLSVATLSALGAFRPEELVPGKIMKRWLVLTYGDGQTGKSYYVQDVCFRLVAAGIPVWYVAAEGFDGIYLRIVAWLAKHPGASLDALRVIPLPVQIFRGGDARILAAQARDLPENERPALIVLDTLHRCVVGARESDNSDMGCMASTAALWRAEVGATTWPIHHEGKQAGQGMRGASCLFDDADSVQYIFRGGDVSVLECEKQKDGIPHFEPEAFTVESLELDAWDFPGLRAGVVKALDHAAIIDARRLWQADQARRMPGAKNAVGDGAGDKTLSETLTTAMKVFEVLYQQHPDGIFKATWREKAIENGVAQGSFDWITKELVRHGKVCQPDSTGRYMPVKTPSD
jgi:hypothetical protein